MNRRGFLSSMLKLAVAPMVLPGAGRLWKATFERVPAINPEWITAPYEEAFLFNHSPWIGLVRRGAFPAGMGDTIRHLTYERSAPALVEPTWRILDA